MRKSLPCRSTILLAALSLSTLSGCGLARQWGWYRPAGQPVPQDYVSPSPEYNPAPVESDPFRELDQQTPMPAPVPADPPPPSFQSGPPAPSVSEYLAPPAGGHSTSPTSQPKPGLIAPQNARRLAPGFGTERPTSTGPKRAAEPNFDEGPVAMVPGGYSVFQPVSQSTVRE